MATIERIVIKNESGYCHIDDSYKDRLVITRNSIKYECRFQMNETRAPICWNYKTTNRQFCELFDRLTDAVQDALEMGYLEKAFDVGPLTFSLTFSDKTRKSITVYKSLSSFDEVYSIVKEMVPIIEHSSTIVL